MKSRLGLLFATLIFAMALAFVMSGYNHKTLTGAMAKESAGPMVSFDAYSKIDKKRDRAAALAKESPRNRSLLWRQHLAYYEARLQLNQRQKDFLRQVSELLDERFFAAPINMSEAEYLKTTRGKPFKELMQNVSKLFTPEQSRQLFFTVGDTSNLTDLGCGTPKRPQVGQATTVRVRYNDPNTAKVKGPNNSEPDPENNPNPFVTCDCTGSLCGSGCGSEQSCRMTIYPLICEPGGSCGCFGLFTCHALCGFFEEG